MDKMRSRKFWLAIVLIALFSILLWWGKLDSDNYVQAVLTLFGIYSGANVATKFIGGGKNG